MEIYMKKLLESNNSLLYPSKNTLTYPILTGSSNVGEYQFELILRKNMEIRSLPFLSFLEMTLNVENG